ARLDERGRARSEWGGRRAPARVAACRSAFVGGGGQDGRMTEVLLFHHAQGLTSGILDFAETLRAEGHVVHTPDLFAGRTFESIPDGVAFAREMGFDALLERGATAVEGLPAGVVYAGFSL